MKRLAKKILPPLIIALLPLIASMQGGTVTLNNPLDPTGGGQALSAFEIYGRLIGGFLFVIGSVSLLFFMYGGVRWLTSGGNEEGIRKGKDAIVWAALGLLVALGSYTILSYIISVVTSAAPGT